MSFTGCCGTTRKGSAFYFAYFVCKRLVLANYPSKTHQPPPVRSYWREKRRDRRESQRCWLAPATGGREEGRPTNKLLGDFQKFLWGGCLEGRTRGEGAHKHIFCRKMGEATGSNRDRSKRTNQKTTYPRWAERDVTPRRKTDRLLGCIL